MIRASDVFEGIKEAIVADRYAFFDPFLANLDNADASVPGRLSEAALRAKAHVAFGSGPYATYACVDSWRTDFRADLPKIDIPVLAVHGTADRILLSGATALSSFLGGEAPDRSVTVAPAGHVNSPPGPRAGARQRP